MPGPAGRCRYLLPSTSMVHRYIYFLVFLEPGQLLTTTIGVVFVDPDEEREERPALPASDVCVTAAGCRTSPYSHI